jgi:hypothetical protein
LSKAPAPNSFWTSWSSAPPIGISACGPAFPGNRSVGGYS